MKKVRILRNPTRTSELNYDDLYDDLDTKIEHFMSRHKHRLVEE